MKWPEIPQSLEGLNAAAIRSLAIEVARALAAAPVKLSAEEKAEWEEYREIGIQLNARANSLAEVEAADAAAADAAAEATAAQAEADRLAAEAAESEETEESEEAEETRELASVGASNLSTSLSIGTERTVERPAGAQWTATGAVPGHEQGSTIESTRELALAVIKAAKAMTAGASSRVDVATMSANFGDRTDFMLSEDPFENLARFDRMRDDAEELEAAFCAPITPLYNLGCENTDRRPVRASLPVFQTPTRGGFSVFPSPTLASVSGGVGKWTSEDDLDPDAIKEACQTIACGTPVDFEIYAIYACLTVKNLLNMTFPELVAAYLNRLQAQRARLAEVQLLEAMGSAADTIAAPEQSFGANVTLKRVILTYLGFHQEMERWDSDGMEAWMPRWLLTALKVDAVSRRTTDGSYPRVPSTEEINASFREIGLNPHWYIDRPSWATPLPALAVGGTMSMFPGEVEILVAKRGKFAFMDRGDLTVGVSPNNIYRLGNDLMKNQFTFFFESFEGLIDTDSCPAHLIQISGLCYNGIQIADRAIGCDGTPAGPDGS